MRMVLLRAMQCKLDIREGEAIAGDLPGMLQLRVM